MDINERELEELLDDDIESIREIDTEHEHSVEIADGIYFIVIEHDHNQVWDIIISNHPDIFAGCTISVDELIDIFCG